MWAIPLKKKISQTVTNEFSNILTKSKRSPPLKLESERGSKRYNSNFQNFMKAKNIQPYPQFTDKGPSIAQRVIRGLRNLFKETSLSKGKC